MIRVVIEIDDPGDMADCAKEAVAERLSDLGRVRIVDVQVDKPKQITFRDGVYRYE